MGHSIKNRTATWLCGTAAEGEGMKRGVEGSVGSARVSEFRECEWTIGAVQEVSIKLCSVGCRKVPCWAGTKVTLGILSWPYRRVPPTPVGPDSQNSNMSTLFCSSYEIYK